MNKSTAEWNRKAMWINVVAGVAWIGIALRDLFAPGLFSISPSLPGGSTLVLDFAAGAALLVCGLCFYQAKPTA